MSTIITRNSATSGSIPSSLVQGELAINVTDGRLFYGSGSGNDVKEFTVSGSGITINTGSFVTTSSFNAYTGSNTSQFAGTASFALTTPTPFRISTGSISASVDIGTDIFRITSGSSTFFNIDNQGSTVISSSASNIFLIKNQNNIPVFTISQSGVVILSTQSLNLTDPAPNGGIYFTSGNLYVGLD